MIVKLAVGGLVQEIFNLRLLLPIPNMIAIRIISSMRVVNVQIRLRSDPAVLAHARHHVVPLPRSVHCLVQRGQYMMALLEEQIA